MAQNAIYNSAIDAYNVPRNVYNAIKNAAAKTGVNFTYLVEKAAAESSFDTNAKSRTSSATGLFQFIESTWLKMVKDHGGKYGLEKYASKIDDNGRVSDPKARKEILNLRKDPEIASLMAAEYDTGNYNRLKENVGGDIGSTELYMAHFLGAGGATGFLNAMKKSPNMTAADLFPKEARANRNVFYDSKTGQPRSLKQVHAMFDQKFKGSQSAPTIMTATNNLRTNAADTVKSAQADTLTTEDPFARLATLMGADNVFASYSASNTASMLRMNDSAGTRTGNNDWQISPPSLYNKLALSPAQMMMLSDFKDA